MWYVDFASKSIKMVKKSPGAAPRTPRCCTHLWTSTPDARRPGAPAEAQRPTRRKGEVADACECIQGNLINLRALCHSFSDFVIAITRATRPMSNFRFYPSYLTTPDLIISSLSIHPSMYHSISCIYRPRPLRARLRARLYSQRLHYPLRRALLLPHTSHYHLTTPSTQARS